MLCYVMQAGIVLFGFFHLAICPVGRLVVLPFLIQIIWSLMDHLLHLVDFQSPSILWFD